jgi:hypothetical protein
MPDITESVADKTSEPEPVEAQRAQPEPEPVEQEPIVPAAQQTVSGADAAMPRATAVERAAARRARIRSRAGHPVDTDDEDDS